MSLDASNSLQVRRLLIVCLVLAGCSGTPPQPVARGSATPNFKDPSSGSDFPAVGAAGSASGGAPAVAAPGAPGGGNAPTQATSPRPNGPSNDPNSPRYAGLPRSNPANLPFDSRYDQLPGYEQVKSLKSPLPPLPVQSKESRRLWIANCMPCHGEDGKGSPGADAVLAGSMRDLSNPYAYKYGASDIAVYRSIAYGLPGSVMGTFLGPLKPNEIWALVGHIKTLQKKS